MALDGEVREPVPTNVRVKPGTLPRQKGYIAGSKAMDSLDRMVTSIESYFHPSNTGLWSLSVRVELTDMEKKFENLSIFFVVDYLPSKTWRRIYKALDGGAARIMQHASCKLEKLGLH